jgi:Cytochrome P450
MPFFVALLLRPEVQTMAQKELDAVTMRERLPTFEDRPRLPFVDAICKEVKRWKPSVPLGELPPLSCLPRKDDGGQVYPAQPQAMTSMRVTSSLRVGILRVQICLAVG